MHIEAPDEASHEGDVEAKIKALEKAPEGAPPPAPSAGDPPAASPAPEPAPAPAPAERSGPLADFALAAPPERPLPGAAGAAPAVAGDIDVKPLVIGKELL